MRRFALACLYMTVVVAPPALGGQLDTFVPAEDGALSCWSRVYDEAHLAAHPDQTVTAMTFGVSYMAATAEYGELYSFWMEARRRDGSRGQATGPCSGEDDQMLCGVECDGGGVIVTPRAGGDVLIDLEAHGYIRMSDSCGSSESGGFALEPGKDDKQFLLRAIPAKACKMAMPY